MPAERLRQAFSLFVPQSQLDRSVAVFFHGFDLRYQARTRLDSGQRDPAAVLEKGLLHIDFGSQNRVNHICFFSNKKRSGGIAFIGFPIRKFLSTL
jgi:hypothetical protein